MRKLFCIAASLVALALAAPAFAADFPEAYDKRFQFELGGAWDSFDTSAKLDYSRGGIVKVGGTVDFEKLLDIPVMKQHLRLTGQWRFSRVSYIQFGYDNIRRAGARVADQDIVWGDTTYNLGAQIDGRFYSDEYYLGYRWDAFKADNVRLGATIGVSYYDLDAALTGQATVTNGDGTTSQKFMERGFAVGAPVPVIGLVGDGAISSSWVFGFYARALYINVDNFSGGTISGGIHVKWYVTRSLGVGAGVDLTALNLKKWVKDNETFSAKYTYAGPRIFAAFAF